MSAAAPWKLNTSAAIWSPRDEFKSQKMLLELVDIQLPVTFSWTRSKDRLRVMGSYGHGPMSRWLEPPPDQTCCGYCYAVASSAALSDRLAIQSFTPRNGKDPVTADDASPAGPTATAGDASAPLRPAPPCYIDPKGDPPGLSPAALAACVSRAHPHHFRGCGGGAIDHRLGDFLASNGVQHCTEADASNVKCPASDGGPTLPACPTDAPVVKARTNSFTLLRHNHTIKAQIMQGPVIAAFKCPTPFVKFGGQPVAKQVGGGAYGGWQKVHWTDDAPEPWSYAFAWHGPSDNAEAGHAITLIGFIQIIIDDPAYKPGSGRKIKVEAWVARNSFGLEWGDKPENGVGHKGYCLYVSTATGYNGALGIGVCNDSASICSDAFDCHQCGSGGVTVGQPGKDDPVKVAPLHCEGCRRESVGAAVLDADVGPDRCGAGDFHITKSTCKSDGSGHVVRRCSKWPADRPDIVLPCDSHFYIGDSESGTKLRKHEHDVRKKPASSGQPAEVGVAADNPGDPKGPVPTVAVPSAAPGRRRHGLTVNELALAITLPILVATLGGVVAAIVVTSRR